MEEIKSYIEARIEFIISTSGKLTKAEEELQKVLAKVNEQLDI